MTAPTLFLFFSTAAIVIALAWALVQLFRDPSKWLRFAVPVLIAAVSALALYSGVVARDRQAQELVKLKPRSLSEQQRAELKKRLSKDTPPIRIVYRLMDGEGKDFSEDIAGAFRDAGATVLSIAGGSLADLRGKVTVVVTNERKTQQAADQLCDTLEAVHIACGGDIPAGSLGGSPAPGEILLVVGRKD